MDTLKTLLFGILEHPKNIILGFLNTLKHNFGSFGHPKTFIIFIFGHPKIFFSGFLDTLKH